VLDRTPAFGTVTLNAFRNQYTNTGHIMKICWNVQKVNITTLFAYSLVCPALYLSRLSNTRVSLLILACKKEHFTNMRR